MPNIALIDPEIDVIIEIAVHNSTRAAMTEAGVITELRTRESGSIRPVELGSAGLVKNPGRTSLTASITWALNSAFEPSTVIKTVHAIVAAAAI